MPITISFFNNKGGVGKKTFLFHVAHRIAELGNTRPPESEWVANSTWPSIPGLGRLQLRRDGVWRIS